MQKKYLVRGGVAEFLLDTSGVPGTKGLSEFVVNHGESTVMAASTDEAIDKALDLLSKRVTKHSAVKVLEADWEFEPTVTETTVERELLAAGVPSLWEGVL